MRRLPFTLLCAALAAIVNFAVAADYMAKPVNLPLANEWLRSQRPEFESWDIGLLARLRFEDKNNFWSGANDFKRITPDPNNTLWLQRVKPHVGWSHGWFSAFVEGRGSYTTSDSRNPNAESDGPMDVHQAWVRLGDAKQFPVTLKLGRQELAYADERLIGTSDWNNIGRVFDAVKLSWETSWFGVDAFASRVVLADENNLNVSNDYEFFSGLYFNSRSLVRKFDAQWYLLARNASRGSPTATTGAPQAGGPAPRDIYTLGARLKSLPRAFGPWDFSTEWMGQFGHFNDPLAPVASLEHRAFAVFAAGGFTWTNLTMKPRLGLEYNFASGDSNPADGRHGTFENLFPTNHRLYGFMDLFSLQNLHNLRLSGSLQPHARVTLTGDVHAFWLADTGDNFYTVGGTRRGGIGTTPGTGYGINPANSTHVGTELDFTATWKLTRYATTQAGYSHFFVGDYIRQSLASPAVGSTDANWFYVQMNFTF